MRTQLRDAEDLTIVLEILDKWITQRTAMDEKLFPDKKDLKKTEYGVWTVEKGKQKRKKSKSENAPTLDKVTKFF